MVGIETKYKKVYSSGKRKAAVARAIIQTGTGKVKFNGRDYKNLEFLKRLRIEEPIRLAENLFGKLEIDCVLNVKGGGAEGQIDAARLALAKGLIAFTQSTELKNAFLSYDRTLLVADSRRKETRKPGDSKARAMRQTSYR